MTDMELLGSSQMQCIFNGVTGIMGMEARTGLAWSMEMGSEASNHACLLGCS